MDGLDLDDQDIEEAREILQDDAEPIVSDDWKDAVAPDEFVWRIQTGKERDGRPVAIEVKAIDPGNQSLLMDYMMSQNKDAAAKSIWEACIIEPKEIVQNYDEVMSGVKLNLTYKLLTMLGFNADFLSTMNRLAQGQMGTSAPDASSTVSQANMDKTQKMLKDGVTESSQMPSTSQKSSDSNDEQTESKTNPSSNQTSEQKSESPTQTSDKDEDQKSITRIESQDT